MMTYCCDAGVVRWATPGRAAADDEARDAPIFRLGDADVNAIVSTITHFIKYGFVCRTDDFVPEYFF